MGTSTLALVVSLLALGLALWSAVATGQRRGAARTDDLDAVPEDVLGLRQEVAALRAEAGTALRHLAVVRFDAFGDMGGQLSWTIALADDAGDGLVLTSIHGRSEARTYAKSLTGWACTQQLSPEEEEAVRHVAAR